MSCTDLEPEANNHLDCSDLELKADINLGCNYLKPENNIRSCYRTLKNSVDIFIGYSVLTLEVKKPEANKQ